MTLWLEFAGRQRRVELPDGATGSFECLIDGEPMTADVTMLQPGVMSLIVGGRQFRCVSEADSVVVNGRRFPFAAMDPRSLRGRKGATSRTDGPKPVKAPMPGRIVRVMVEVGDSVVAQQGLAIMEAMKMQNELKSPKSGKVARVAVAVGQTVQSGDVVFIVE